ncbi:phosphopentomutase [Rhodobacterales bacterium 52_120_T64]|nr:phosphopentomutase [Rhodobacterales bacterium 52_120_T64]
MARALILVLDSVGCGGAPDAAQFGDEGSNTLGHIADACANGTAEEGRSGALALPNLDRLGLGAAIRLASSHVAPGLNAGAVGLYGAATEVSQGKDTPSGHWEISGVPVPFDWHYFADTVPAFPAEKIEEFVRRAKIPGILGDCHASGMPILQDLGEEHIRTGKPICYTSADSVFQIAAHEEHFGLDRLYEICAIAAEIFHPMMIGRVIARPFIGETAETFTRTINRKDLAIEPPEDTICDRVVAAGGRTLAVGKIGDIFAHRGITELRKGKRDLELVDDLLDFIAEAGDGDFIFTNLVEFDSLYGHPRDVAGYARALEAFDERLPEITGALKTGDLLIITADHGNDPTWHGTDHTRERVPVLCISPGLEDREIGLVGMADIGETIAAHLGLKPGRHGRSFL